ncbi:MAG TPA: glutaredoxin family protein [Candidatus Acidoferrales bacterium]|nr:glutaredoxin family protein [Candidatus Acidoferrales bacterium]
MSEVTIYGTTWCCDCRRAKKFLRERGVEFREVNIDEKQEAEAIVLRVNNGLRKVPTIEVEGRYFSCSPFDPYRLAEELKIPLNR